MAAPAVRVLMRERLAMPEPAAFLQRLFDLRVRVEHTLAAEELDVLVEVPARSDRRVDLEAVAQARVEVVRAVAGRRVNRASARVERDVLAEHADGIALIKRMAEADAFEVRALHLRDGCRQIAADDLADRLGKLLGEDHRPAVDVVCRVVELRMKRDGKIATESSTASSSRSGRRRLRPFSAGTRAASSLALASASGNST